MTAGVDARLQWVRDQAPALAQWALVLLALLLAWRAVTATERDTRGVSFALAGDAARTALSDFYRDRSALGRPGLPHSIAELGPGALATDPLTGRADWEPERDLTGAITGFHSRSTARAPDRDVLARVAHLRRDLPASAVPGTQASDWSFAWVPPPAAVNARAAPVLTALDALQGRWPGTPAVTPVARAFHRRRLMAALNPTGTRALPHPALAPGRPDPIAPVPTPSTAAPLLVPFRPGRAALVAASHDLPPPAGVTDALPARRSAAMAVPVPVPATATASSRALLADASPASGGEPTVKAAEAEGPAFSDDEATLDCQLRIAVNGDAACRGPKSYPDGGALYQQCLSDYQDKMRSCIADFGNSQ